MLRAVVIFVLALGGSASADVTLTVTTTPSGGNYAPRNVVAAWIETAAGNFVRTIGRHANVRKIHLVAWQAKAGANDVDAVSGSTRSSHGPLTFKWNLRDKQGQVMPDGDYVVRVELADENANTAGQNNQGTFPFTKGPTPNTQSNLSNGGFTNGTLVFNLQTNLCGNGALEAGETCDGNCPTSCPPSTIMCFSNNLTGDAAQCNAQCANQPLTVCEADGCCPSGCEGMDPDCPGGDGGGDPAEISNCSTSDPHPGLLLIGLVIGLVVLRRRRLPRGR